MPTAFACVAAVIHQIAEICHFCTGAAAGLGARGGKFRLVTLMLTC